MSFGGKGVDLALPLPGELPLPVDQSVLLEGAQHGVESPLAALERMAAAFLDLPGDSVAMTGTIPQDSQNQGWGAPPEQLTLGFHNEIIPRHAAYCQCRGIY